MKEKILKSNIFWIVCIIIVWEIVSRLGIVSQYVLPPFSKVFYQLFNEIKNGEILIQVLNSFRIVLSGIIFSIILSIIVFICITSRPSASILHNVFMLNFISYSLFAISSTFICILSYIIYFANKEPHKAAPLYN